MGFLDGHGLVNLGLDLESVQKDDLLSQKYEISQAIIQIIL